MAFNWIDLGLRAVRLKLLGEHDEFRCYGTGFCLREATGTFLYTCWHVVTGIDFLDPKITAQDWPPKRRKIAIHAQSIKDSAPGTILIDGGASERILPLYESSGGKLAPVWLQESDERPHADLNAVDIRIPKWADLVRIPIQVNEAESKLLVIDKSRLYRFMLDAMRPATVVGYPYGYSSLGEHFPSPVFLTRNIAALSSASRHTVLLDGTGAPGMSGSPVFVVERNNWLLAGIYTGTLFPDFEQLSTPAERNDRSAALGMFYPISKCQHLFNPPTGKA